MHLKQIPALKINLYRSQVNKPFECAFTTFERTIDYLLTFCDKLLNSGGKNVYLKTKIKKKTIFSSRI